RVQQIPLLQMIISLFLAYYLFKLRPRAEALTLGLAILASVVQPLLLFWKLPVSAALIESLPVWGMTGALLLLLTGDPSRARRLTALALFCVFTVGLYALAIVGRVAE